MRLARRDRHPAKQNHREFRNYLGMQKYFVWRRVQKAIDGPFFLPSWFQLWCSVANLVSMGMALNSGAGALEFKVRRNRRN